MPKPLRILVWLLGSAALIAAALTYTLETPVPRGDGSKAESNATEVSEAPITPRDEALWMREETVTNDGTRQFPSSLEKEAGSVEQRIIDILKRENSALVEDLKVQERRLKELQIDLQLLRAQNEPDQAPDDEQTVMSLENRRAGEQIRELLEASSLTRQLSPPEKQIVATLAIRSYLEIMRRSRLGMAEELRQIILTRLLPKYSHCLSEGIPFIAATPTERDRLLRYLDTGNEQLLDYRYLREDYETITQECFSALTHSINQRIAAG